MVRVISSTGIVHDAEKMGDLYQTICNHSNGPSYFTDMLKSWEETDKPVTCKNCLRITNESNNQLVEPECYLNKDNGDLYIIYYTQNRPQGKNWIRISYKAYKILSRSN